MISLPHPQYECQDYKELAGINEAFGLVREDTKDWLFQLKYDGIWALVVLDKGLCSVFSKTGQLKHSFQLPQLAFSYEKTILVGEFMFGSQWAQTEDRKGKIYVFDCLFSRGSDVSHLPYSSRFSLATGVVDELGPVFTMVASYALTNLGKVWEKIERDHSYEGIVMRQWRSTWYAQLHKIKVEIEDDYVIVGFQPGKGKHTGRLGSLRVGQVSKTGVLEYLMDVGGGYTDEIRRYIWNNQAILLGSVCRVSGKARFDSGALRHPNFVQFRDDKLPADCTHHE